MKLQELFHAQDVLVGFTAQDKWDAIDRMMTHLVGSERFGREALAALQEAVLGRERSMSTGMERGLAIPHAAVDELEEVVACLAVTGETAAIPFESIDASPARILVLLLIPRAQKLIHIRTLAEVARVLQSEAVRNALYAASTADEAWHALAETG
jgi:mannitol/fructose-specific phosphotransferase system IIA component (Ntr-type)